MTESRRETCILVVDDMPNWREQIVEILKEDYYVRAFHTFEEAAQAIQDLDFDIAVLDVRLYDPSRDVMGFELLRRIREANLRTAVVILTGYSADVTEEAIETYQPDRFFRKETFNIEAFRKAIQDIAEQQHIQDGGYRNRHG